MEKYQTCTRITNKDFVNFKNDVVGANHKRHVFEVTNSNGTKEAWRWLKKNKWLNLSQPVTERQFGYIIKTINSYLQDQLLSGKDIVLPHRMGVLELRKFSTPVSLVNDKVVTYRPVNWQETVRLWWEDKEAYNNKTLVRHDIQEIYTVYYNKSKALYKNKSFYKYTPTRVIKKRLRDKITRGETDALLLQKKNELYKYKANNEQAHKTSNA